MDKLVPWSTSSFEWLPDFLYYLGYVSCPNQGSMHQNRFKNRDRAAAGNFVISGRHHTNKYRNIAPTRTDRSANQAVRRSPARTILDVNGNQQTIWDECCSRVRGFFNGPEMIFVYFWSCMFIILLSTICLHLISIYSLEPFLKLRLWLMWPWMTPWTWDLEVCIDKPLPEVRQFQWIKNGFQKPWRVQLSQN